MKGASPHERQHHFPASGTVLVVSRRVPRDSRTCPDDAADVWREDPGRALVHAGPWDAGRGPDYPGTRAIALHLALDSRGDLHAVRRLPVVGAARHAHAALHRPRERRPALPGVRDDVGRWVYLHPGRPERGPAHRHGLLSRAVV